MQAVQARQEPPSGRNLNGPKPEHEPSDRSPGYLRSMPRTNNRAVLSVSGSTRILPRLLRRFTNDVGQRLASVRDDKERWSRPRLF